METSFQITASDSRSGDTQPAVDIVIVLWNQVDYTRRCVESLIKNTKIPFRIILIDNASSDGTPQFAENLTQQQIPGVKIVYVRNTENLNYVLGVNQGIGFTQAPFVLLANNDIEVYPGSIEELLRVANTEDRIGLINPLCNDHNVPSYQPEQLARDQGKCMELHHTSGFFVLLKRSVIQAIGGLDTVYSPGYFDDMDYSEKAKAAGFRCVLALGAYVYHYGNKSFGSDYKARLWKKHEAIFEKRWSKIQYFAFWGETKQMKDPESAKLISAQLMKMMTHTRIVFYLYLPPGTSEYFRHLHIGFRIIEKNTLSRFFMLVGKLLRKRKNKSISEVYFSNECCKKKWAFLSRLLRIKTRCLPV